MRPRGRQDYVKVFWKAIKQIAEERKTTPKKVFTELVKKQIEKALEGDYRFTSMISEKVFYVPDDKGYDAVRVIFEDYTNVNNDKEETT